MSALRRRYGLSKQSGLSRKELLIIAAILVVGVVAFYIALAPKLDEARDTKARQDLNRINLALQQYKLDNQHYPFQSRGLAALLHPDDDDRPSWNGPYLPREKLTIDPWGRPYRYELGRDASIVTVVSLGADGQAGGDGPDADIFLKIETP